MNIIGKEIAVIVATYNRPVKIIYCLLNFLNKSIFKNFICFINDSSDNNTTLNYINYYKKNYDFDIVYMKANKKGVCTQRNECIEYVLNNYKDIKYFIVLDDDIKINKRTIGEIYKRFNKDNSIKHITIPISYNVFNKKFTPITYVSNILRFEHNKTNNNISYSNAPSAYRREIFENYKIFYPEIFQSISGSGFLEDCAFSVAVTKFYNQEPYFLGEKYNCYHMDETLKRYFNNKQIEMIFFNRLLLFEFYNKDIKGIRKFILRWKLYYYTYKYIKDIQKMKATSSKFNVFTIFSEFFKALDKYKNYIKINKIENIFKKEKHT